MKDRILRAYELEDGDPAWCRCKDLDLDCCCEREIRLEPEWLRDNVEFTDSDLQYLGDYVFLLALYLMDNKSARWSKAGLSKLGPGWYKVWYGPKSILQDWLDQLPEQIQRFPDIQDNYIKAGQENNV